MNMENVGKPFWFQVFTGGRAHSLPGSVAMPECRVSAKLLATQEILGDQPGFRRQAWLIWVLTLFEVLSTLVLVQAGQQLDTSQTGIFAGIGILAIQLLLAVWAGHFANVRRTGKFTCEFQQATGLHAFFPARYSAFGLFRKQQQVWCFLF